MPNQTGKNQHTKAAKMERADALNKELARHVEFNTEYLREIFDGKHGLPDAPASTAARVTSIIDQLIDYSVSKELTADRLRLVREQFIKSLGVEEYRTLHGGMGFRTIVKVKRT